MTHLKTTGLAALACLVFLGGCATPKPPEKPMFKDVEFGAQWTPEAIVRESQAIWNDQRPDRLPIVFAENVVFEDVAYGFRGVGLKALLTYYQDNWKTFPDLRIGLLSMFSDGQHIATQWIMTGTQYGDLPGLPATRRKISIRGASISEIKDGHIVRMTDYYDSAEFYRQLRGQTPAAEEAPSPQK